MSASYGVNDEIPQQHVTLIRQGKYWLEVGDQTRIETFNREGYLNTNFGGGNAFILAKIPEVGGVIGILNNRLGVERDNTPIHGLRLIVDVSALDTADSNNTARNSNSNASNSNSNNGNSNNSNSGNTHNTANNHHDTHNTASNSGNSNSSNSNSNNSNSNNTHNTTNNNHNTQNTNSNSGNSNSGNSNSGNSNSNNTHNTTNNHHNTQNTNSNSGNSNSGNSNSGNTNSGNTNNTTTNHHTTNNTTSNSGNSNSGNVNSGNSNCGNTTNTTSNSNNTNSNSGSNSNFGKSTNSNFGSVGDYSGFASNNSHPDPNNLTDRIKALERQLEQLSSRPQIPSQPQIQAENGVWKTKYLPDNQTEHRIGFSKQFKKIPMVTASISSADVGKNANFRLRVWVSGVDLKGFTINVKTWDDTWLYECWVSWTAIGN